MKADWKDKSRNPKVAFFYGDNAYGKAPIEAGRRCRQGERIDLVDEEIVPETSGRDEPAPQHEGEGGRLRLHQRDDDGRVAHPQGREGLGLATKFGSNPYGFSEALPAVAREAAEGVTGVMPHVPFGENVPGMASIVEFHKANHPNDTHDALYVRGWAYALTWTEALKRADKAGKLTGEGVRARRRP